MANNAYIQFNKSRASASKASLKNSYQVKYFTFLIMV